MERRRGGRPPFNASTCILHGEEGGREGEENWLRVLSAATTQLRFDLYQQGANFAISRGNRCSSARFCIMRSPLTLASRNRRRLGACLRALLDRRPIKGSRIMRRLEFLFFFFEAESKITHVARVFLRFWILSRIYPWKFEILNI